MKKEYIKKGLAFFLTLLIVVQSVDFSVFAELSTEAVEDEETETPEETPVDTAEQVADGEEEVLQSDTEEIKPMTSRVSASAEDVTKYLQPDEVVLYTDEKQELGDQTVQIGMELIIHYTFQFALEGTQQIRGGDYAYLDLPAVFEMADSSIAIYDQNGNNIAEVIFKAGEQRGKVVFTDEINSVRSGSFYFELQVKLSKEVIGDGGSQVVEFILNGKKVIVNINFEKVTMDIQKELTDQYFEKGVLYQDWKLTINQYQKELKELVLTDVLPEGLAYKTFSFVNANGDKINKGNWSDASVSGNKVTFTHNAVMSEEMYLVVTTYAADFSKWDKKDGVYHVTNSVYLDGKDTKGMGLDRVEDQADTSFKMDLLKKTGSYEMSEGGIVWNITVNEEKADLPKAKVIDIIPAGLSMLEDTIVIRKEGSASPVTVGKAGTGSYDVVWTAAAESAGMTYTFSFGDITGSYSIEYVTEITKEGFYTSQKEEEFSNVAYLSWEGSGEGLSTFETDRSASVVKASNNWINQFASNHWHLEKKDSYAEWHMVINESRQKVSGEVVLEDHLQIWNWQSYGPYYQQVVESTIEVSYLKADGSTEEVKSSAYQVEVFDKTNKYNQKDKAGFRITFRDGVVNERAVYVKFHSVISEETQNNLDIMVTNTSPSTYGNTALLFVEIGGVQKDFKSERTVWASLRISEKYSDSYNYGTHTFGWRVHVNEAEYIGLGETRLEDHLPEYNVYDYVEVYETERTNGTFKVDLVTLTGSGGSGSRKANKQKPLDKSKYDITWQKSDDYSKTGDVVTVTFKDGVLDDRSYAVLIYSTMADEYYEEARGSRSFKNISYIYAENAENYQTNKDASRTVNASEPSLSKAGSIDLEEGIFTWEAMVNTNGNYDLRGAVVEDVLQKGLLLDVDSIQLYRYAVSTSNGSLGSEIKMDIDLNEWLIYDLESNAFTFSFPQDLSDEEAVSAYKIRFDTVIEEDGTYSNGVTMSIKGKTVIESDETQEKIVVMSELGAGAVVNRSARITLKKTDKSGKVLPNAVFALMNQAGVILEEGTSDAGGMIAFSTWLELEQEYYLQEVIPPSGYKRTSEKIPVYIEKDSSGKAIASSLAYAAENDEIDKTFLKVIKKDSDITYQNEKLAGAQFQLYKKNTAGQWVLNQTKVTGTEGTLVFEGLGEGAYRLIETMAPEGYEEAEEEFLFSVVPDADYQNLLIYNASGNQITSKSVTVTNTYIKRGTLEIHKIDSENNNLYLSGAEFKLEYKEKQNGTYTVYKEKIETGDTGKVQIADLPLGYYRLTETTAPRGYKLTEAIEFAVTRENGVEKVCTVIVENEKITIPVELIKVDAEDKKKLEGAEFTVTPFIWEYYGTGQYDRNPVPGSVEEVIYNSDQNGRIDLGERAFGLYAVQEVKAPAGYQLSDDFLVIEITHPLTEADGEYRILYWDVTELEDGTYDYKQRKADQYGAEINYIYNEKQQYNLTIRKQDDVTGEGLPGAEFLVKDSKNNQIENKAHKDGYFVTGSRGSVTIEVPEGIYTITEVKAPRGYELSSTEEREQTVSVPNSYAQGTAAIMDSIAEVQAVFKNKKITESFIFTKTDGADPIKNHSAYFNLYHVEVDEKNQISILTVDDIEQVLETDETGKLKLEGLTEGFYVIQERSAPKGFVRSLDLYGIQLVWNEKDWNYDTYFYHVPGGMNNVTTTDLTELYKRYGEAEFTDIEKVVNEKEVVHFYLTVYKQNEENEPLGGAKFEILDSSGSPVTVAGESIFETDNSGQIRLELPEGEYIVKEVEAPEGYAVNLNGEKVNLKRNVAVEIKNKPLNKSITFQKKGEENSVGLNGATFALYSIDVTQTGSKLELNSFDPIPALYVSAEQGKIELKDLMSGWYALQEILPPNGYSRSLDIIAIHLYPNDSKTGLEYELYDIAGGMANIDQVEKREKNDLIITNKKMAADAPGFSLMLYKTSDSGAGLAGIVFGIYQDKNGQNPLLDERNEPVKLETDSFGMAEISLPEGTYYLKEEIGAAGYVPLSSMVEIDGNKQQTVYLHKEIINEAVTAKDEIIIQKQGEYGEIIEGAIFNLYKVDARFENDGSVTLLSADPVRFMERVESDKEGNIRLGELPYGFYAVQEAIPVGDYVRNLESVIGIHVDETGKVSYYKVDREDYTNIEELTVDEGGFPVIINEHAHYSVIVQKLDKKYQVPITGAAFDLYYITKEEQEVKIDSFVIGSTGEEELDLAAGEYILRETKAPDGYKRVDIEFTVDASGGSQRVTYVTVEDEPILAGIEAVKVDESGKPLEGAEFALYSMEVEVDEDGLFHYISDKFIRQYESDGDGKIDVEDLKTGWYALQETAAPGEYMRNLDVLAFYVEIDEAEQPRITCYDVFGGKINADTYYERELEEGGTVYLRNVKENAKRAELIILKINDFSYDDYDKDQTQALHDKISLPGTKFRIWQKIGMDDQVQVTEGAGSDGLYTTDLTGRIRVNLVPGTYLIEEVQNAAGYLMQDGGSSEIVQEIVIEEKDLESSRTLTYEIENIAAGALQLKKTDENGKELEGVAFILYREVQVIDNNMISSNRIYNGTYVTDKAGNIEIDNLRPGTYYLEESQPLPGYMAAETEKFIIDGEALLTVYREIKNEQAAVDVEISKIDRISRKELSDAGFTLFKKSNEEWEEQKKGIKTDGKGTAVLTGLTAGFYLLRETDVPQGYSSDHDTEFEIRAVQGGAALYVDDLEDTDKKLVIENTPITGSVEITKQDEEGNPLAGAYFALYAEGREEPLISAASVDASGKLIFDNLEYGVAYTVKEVKAPAGWLLEEKEYPIVIKEQEEVVRLEITNKKIKGSVLIAKRDRDTRELLAGAEFTLYDENGDVVKAETTGERGTVRFDKVAYGSYTLEETKVPDGYMGSDEKWTVEISDEGELIEITVLNEEIKGSVEIRKTDNIDRNKYLSGAVFELYRYEQETQGYTEKIGDTYTTNADGRILLEGLPYGRYMLREIQAPIGYMIEEADHYFELTDTVNISLTIENTRLGSVQITKVDGQDAQILLNGVSFRLERLMEESYENWPDEKTVYETVNGQLTIESLPEGSYRLWELETVYGYKLPQEPVEFTINTAVGIQQPRKLIIKNEPVTADLTLRKVDEAERGLEGAVFHLYRVSDGKYYEAGAYTSEENGVLEIGSLRHGEYKLVEVLAPEGYMASEEEIRISVTLDGERADVSVNADTTLKTDQDGIILISNTPDKSVIYGDGQVLITKRDATDEGLVLKGASYRLEKEREGVWGEYPVNGVAEFTTNQYGHILLDLDVGEYRVKETAAPDGYDLDESDVYHSFTVNGNQQRILYVDVANRPSVLGEIVITKVDAADRGKTLEGAGFSLYKVRTEGTSRYMGSYTTDEEGEIHIKDLPLHEYSLVETKAPTGYLMPENNTDMKVLLNERTYKLDLEIQNISVAGRVELHKYDAHSGTSLEGIPFRLYYRQEEDAAWQPYTQELYYTDGYGRIRFTSLVNGFYKVEEAGAPEGYAAAEPHYFEVYLSEETLEGEKQDVFVEDLYIKNERLTNAVLQKIDAEEKEVSLPGAVFVLEEFSDGAYQIRNEELVTDENGEILLEDLTTGNYRLRETQAPKGYQLRESAVDFDILYDETQTGLIIVMHGEKTERIVVENVKQKQISIQKPGGGSGKDDDYDDGDGRPGGPGKESPAGTIYNKIRESVKTGDKAGIAVYVILLSLSACAAGYLMRKKRKRKY